jgi:hypothetical protein
MRGIFSLEKEKTMHDQEEILVMRKGPFYGLSIASSKLQADFSAICSPPPGWKMKSKLIKILLSILFLLFVYSDAELRAL